MSDHTNQRVRGPVEQSGRRALFPKPQYLPEFSEPFERPPPAFGRAIPVPSGACRGSVGGALSSGRAGTPCPEIYPKGLRFAAELWPLRTFHSPIIALGVNSLNRD